MNGCGQAQPPQPRGPRGCEEGVSLLQAMLRGSGKRLGPGAAVAPVSGEAGLSPWGPGDSEGSRRPEGQRQSAGLLGVGDTAKALAGS